MTNSYDVGDLVRIKATFKDLNDALADPTTVTCEYKKPDGTVISGDATKESTGVYRYDVAPDAAGTWYYRMSGIGNVQAASESRFIVRKSEVLA